MDTLTREEIERRISDSYELPNKVLELIPEPLVSVRTSTYNHGPYIKECIEGVLMQKTTFPVEYIIGEDYSTDETRSIVFEYAKKYPEKIRVITADYNVGAKANGRRCSRACRGKYMAPCEGDDYWTDPHKLQKQVDFLEKNPEYTIVCHNAIRQDAESGKQLGLFNKRKIKKLEMKDIIKTWCIPTASIVCRTWCYHKMPVWRDRVPQGDIILQMICFNEGKCKYFEDIMSVYRIMVPGSASERVMKDPLKYLYGHRLLWEKMNEELNYKYKRYIDLKIKETNFNIFKIKSIIKFPFLKKLKIS